MLLHCESSVILDELLNVIFANSRNSFFVDFSFIFCYYHHIGFCCLFSVNKSTLFKRYTDIRFADLRQTKDIESKINFYFLKVYEFSAYRRLNLVHLIEKYVAC